jgi:hypothetical protein
MKPFAIIPWRLEYAEKLFMDIFEENVLMAGAAVFDYS